MYWYIARPGRCPFVVVQKRGAALVFENDVQGVDDARDITQDRQEDVDEQVGSATALKEDAQWREKDSEDDLADVACGESHLDGFFVTRFFDENDDGVGAYCVLRVACCVVCALDGRMLKGIYCEVQGCGRLVRLA